MSNVKRKPPSLFRWLLSLSFKFSDYLFSLKFSYNKEAEKSNSIHHIKATPKFFDSLYTGHKKFEFRLNDRNYRVRDILVIHEYDKDKNQYTGRSCKRVVTFVLSSDEGFAMLRDWVILSLVRA
jgi:hypothetical protein